MQPGRRAELIKPLDELTIAGIITMWQTYRRRTMVVVMPAIWVGLFVVLFGAPKLYDELVLDMAWLSAIGAGGVALGALVLVVIAVLLLARAVGGVARRALRQYGEVMDIEGDVVDAIVTSPPMLEWMPGGRRSSSARDGDAAQNLAA